MLVSASQGRAQPSTGNDGQDLLGADKNVRAPNWAESAKRWWAKPDAYLALIADADPRSARRWMRGECDPPPVVVLAIINKLFERG